MLMVLKSDIFRLKKWKSIYCFAGVTMLLALSLIAMTSNDIRLGISIFGNLTMFRDLKDIFVFGIDFRKGLGIIVAILISTFIGEEYRWNTIKLKILAGKSREKIYITKMIESIMISVFIYLIYELMILLGMSFTTNNISTILNINNMLRLLCGIALYTALGSIIGCIAILIKKPTISAMICIIYVLAGETINSILNSLSNLSSQISSLIMLIMKYSLNSQIPNMYSDNCTYETILSVLISMLLAVIVTLGVGIICIKKYDYR